MEQCVLKIKDNGQEKSIPFTPPARLSELFSKHGIAVEMPCGGRQRCLKCKVEATGSLSPMSEREISLLTEKEKAENIRYACMATALGDVQARLLSGRYRDDILTEGRLPLFELKPWAGTTARRST